MCILDCTGKLWYPRGSLPVKSASAEGCQNPTIHQVFQKSLGGFLLTSRGSTWGFRLHQTIWFNYPEVAEIWAEFFQRNMLEVIFFTGFIYFFLLISKNSWRNEAWGCDRGLNQQQPGKRPSLWCMSSPSEYTTDYTVGWKKKSSWKNITASILPQTGERVSFWLLLFLLRLVI